MSLEYETRQQNSALTALKQRAAPPALTDQKPNVDYDTIRPELVVTDVIFNDPHSLFLQEAEKRGAKTINGLGMLVNQGALNFKLWTGVEPPVEVMKDVLKREFGLEKAG